MAENSEKKVGRPPIEKPKNRTIKIRLTEEEYTRLYFESRRRCLSMSEYLRKMAAL